jgi:hypothetical protein
MGRVRTPEDRWRHPFSGEAAPSAPQLLQERSSIVNERAPTRVGGCTLDDNKLTGLVTREQDQTTKPACCQPEFTRAVFRKQCRAPVRGTQRVSLP